MAFLQDTVVLSFLLLVSIISKPADSFSIGSFNVKMFGLKKMENEEVVNNLIDVIQRYDIILIQEIRDKSGKALADLLERVNDGNHLYDVEVSERLGRSSSKEQFAFFYRVDRDIAVADTMHWNDVGDLFEREPFAVRFEAPHCSLPDFVLVAVHIDPDDVEHELNALVKVKDDLQTSWFADNILFMGDFNADCRYFNDDAKDRSLLNSDDYVWWIDDDEDTTITNTDCAYDRFIMIGDEFVDTVICDSVGVFRFDEEYDLAKETALLVSDHYPIEMELQECSYRKEYHDSEDEDRVLRHIEL